MIHMDAQQDHQNREYPSAPLIGVGAVIIKEGKILLVKRAFAPGEGKWSIPGGLVELGEKLSDACERETEEETGLKVKVLELINVFVMIERDSSRKVKYHYALVDFLAKPVGGAENPNNEVLEMKWATIDEARSLDLTRTARRALDELFGAGTAQV